MSHGTEQRTLKSGETVSLPKGKEKDRYIKLNQEERDRVYESLRQLSGDLKFNRNEISKSIWEQVASPWLNYTLNKTPASALKGMPISQAILNAATQAKAAGGLGERSARSVMYYCLDYLQNAAENRGNSNNTGLKNIDDVKSDEFVEILNQGGRWQLKVMTASGEVRMQGYLFPEEKPTPRPAPPAPPEPAPPAPQPAPPAPPEPAPPAPPEPAPPAPPEPAPPAPQPAPAPDEPERVQPDVGWIEFGRFKEIPSVMGVALAQVKATESFDAEPNPFTEAYELAASIPIDRARYTDFATLESQLKQVAEFVPVYKPGIEALKRLDDAATKNPNSMATLHAKKDLRAVQLDFVENRSSFAQLGTFTDLLHPTLIEEIKFIYVDASEIRNDQVRIQEELTNRASTVAEFLHGASHEITDATFQAEVLESDTPVLVDYFAYWCGPCAAMAPSIASAETAYAGRVKVARFDADPEWHQAGAEKPVVPSEQGVSAFPTTVLYYQGRELGRLEGAASDADLRAFIDAQLAALPASPPPEATPSIPEAYPKLGELTAEDQAQLARLKADTTLFTNAMPLDDADPLAVLDRSLSAGGDYSSKHEDLAKRVHLAREFREKTYELSTYKFGIEEYIRLAQSGETTGLDTPDNIRALLDKSIALAESLFSPSSPYQTLADSTDFLHADARAFVKDNTLLNTLYRYRTEIGGYLATGNASVLPTLA